MKIRNKTIVPRNPYAVAASQKKAGKHLQGQKTKRQQAKKQLKEMLEQTEKGGKFPPFSFHPLGCFTAHFAP